MNPLAYNLPDNVEMPNPEGGLRNLHLNQLFPGRGKPIDNRKKYYVGKPFDIVHDVANGKQWYIHSIDSEYAPDLRPYNPNNAPDTQKGVLKGFGVGSVNEAYRIFYNRRTVPNTLTICKFCYLEGKEVVGYRLFRGYDTTNNGEVISRHYDQSGKYTGDIIPVETHYQFTEWRSVPKISNVQDTQLKHGDIVTAVFLNKSGTPCSEAMLKVVETNLTPSLNRPVKEIKEVTIQSPMLDPNDDTTLLVPNHMPIQDIILQGVVHYTDGTKKTFDFDQTSGQLHGLEGRVLSRPDLVYDLSATYYLEDSEFSPMAGTGQRRHISFPMQLKTYSPDNNNPVKLYMSPHWKGDMLGWELHYWLLDLERNKPINVTSLVTYHPEYPYNPLMFNNTQKVLASIELEKVHPRYLKYTHPQDFDIQLMGRPDNNRDNWRIQYTLGNGFFGEGVKATHVNENGTSTLNISNGFTRWSQFCIAHYQKVSPVSDINQGIYAPEPSHVEVFHNGVTKILNPANFQEDFVWPTGLSNGDTLELRWLMKKGSDYQYLAMTPMAVTGL